MGNINGVERDFKEIGIDIEPVETAKRNAYSVDLTDEEFGRFYSILDKSNDVECFEDNSQLTIHGINLNYLYKNYLVTLISDYDQDTEKMLITELSNDQLERMLDDSEEESGDELEDEQ